MSKANEPTDSPRAGKVTPPWKRGETTSATPTTAMTAGQMAKAAAAGAEFPPVGPPSTGPTGPADAGGPNKRTPPAAPEAPGGPAKGPGSKSPQASGASATPTGPQQGPAAPQNRPAAPPQGPAAPPQPQQSVQPQQQAPSGAPTTAMPAAAPGARGPVPSRSAEPTGPAGAGDAPAGAERPDLDSIHRTGAGTDPAGRAAVRRIPASSTIGTPLRAAVQVRRVDPWSIFKVTGVLAAAGFLIWMIAIAVLYGVLAGMGVWDQINSSFATIVSADGTSEGGDLLTAGQVFGFSALFGIFAAVILTAFATIMAYIYNVCADVVGGFEVTLADLD